MFVPPELERRPQNSTNLLRFLTHAPFFFLCYTKFHCYFPFLSTKLRLEAHIFSMKTLQRYNAPTPHASLLYSVGEAQGGSLSFSRLSAPRFGALASKFSAHRHFHHWVVIFVCSMPEAFAVPIVNFSDLVASNSTRMCHKESFAYKKAFYALNLLFTTSNIFFVQSCCLP